MQAGVSAGVGVLCLVAAGLLIVAGEWQWPRLIVALVLTGVAGLTHATVGNVMHRSVTRLDARVSGVVGGWTGVAVTGVVGVVLLGLLAFWVWHKQVDMKTVGVAAAVPLSVSLIPGPLGTFAAGLVSIVPAMLGGAVAWLFGLGG